ncbi:hypothetical protein KK617_18385 [Nocardioides sp. ChNu-99]|nr:hypothetical protein [Nocardioides sp. ChNu-99]
MTDAPHKAIYTEEGGGTVVTCSCGWLQWHPTDPSARRAAADHRRSKTPSESP